MKRIVFVEDAEVLRQLFEVILSKEHGQWHVHTSPDGPAALALMKQFTFDVVVSDMRMPGMDGIELLKEVRRLYPRTSRIIISGIGDQAEAAEALDSTHQFIPKPFQAKTLLAALARIRGLDAYLKDEKLKALVGQLRTLPSFPALYLEIMEVIESEKSSLQAIADVIAKDPGITAKTMQVANSAAFGAPEEIHDPIAAVQQLGMSNVRSLALSAHVFGSYGPARVKHFPADALWAHLMRCAAGARAIMQAEQSEPDDVEDAFTAGMLHDIGKLMLADSLPERFQDALSLAAQSRVPLHEVERKEFGATHAGLAAYLLGLWGLPAPIVEAVAFHHTPEKSTHPQFGPLAAVHVANALGHEAAGDPAGLNLDYLAQIGRADRLDVWRDEVQKINRAEKS